MEPKELKPPASKIPVPTFRSFIPKPVNKGVKLQQQGATHVKNLITSKAPTHTKSAPKRPLSSKAEIQSVKATSSKQAVSRAVVLSKPNLSARTVVPSVKNAIVLTKNAESSTRTVVSSKKFHGGGASSIRTSRTVLSSVSKPVSSSIKIAPSTSKPVKLATKPLVSKFKPLSSGIKPIVKAEQSAISVKKFRASPKKSTAANTRHKTSRDNLSSYRNVPIVKSRNIVPTTRKRPLLSEQYIDHNKKNASKDKGQNFPFKSPMHSKSKCLSTECNASSERDKNLNEDMENKENVPVMPARISQQKDIVFEPNEFCRNLILNNKELTPSILKVNPGFKLSTLKTDRPSIFKKLELVDDPALEALTAIKQLKLKSKKQDIEFEPNAFCQNLIMNNKELSPSMFNMNTGFKLSTFKTDRPSIYKQLKPVEDPFLEAMKAIKDLKITSKKQDIEFEPNEFCRNLIMNNKELSPSMLNMNTGFKRSTYRTDRPSIYKTLEPVEDPFLEAMKAIKDLKITSKRQTVTGTSQPRFSTILTPAKERYSFIKSKNQCGDPFQEAMQRIMEIRQKKQLQKKVTFASSVTDYSEKLSLPNENVDSCSSVILTETETRLTDISEKSENNSSRSSKCEDFPQMPARGLNDTAFPTESSVTEDSSNLSPCSSYSNKKDICGVSSSLQCVNLEDAKEQLDFRKNTEPKINALHYESAVNCLQPKSILINSAAKVKSCTNFSYKYRTPIASSRYDPISISKRLSSLKIPKLSSVKTNKDAVFKCSEKRFASQNCERKIDNQYCGKKNSVPNCAKKLDFKNCEKESMQMLNSDRCPEIVSQTMLSCTSKYSEIFSSCSPPESSIGVDHNVEDFESKCSESENICDTKDMNDEVFLDPENTDERDSFTRLLDFLPVNRSSIFSTEEPHVPTFLSSAVKESDFKSTNSSVHQCSGDYVNASKAKWNVALSECDAMLNEVNSDSVKACNSRTVVSNDQTNIDSKKPLVHHLNKQCPETPSNFREAYPQIYSTLKPRTRSKIEKINKCGLYTPQITSFKPPYRCVSESSLNLLNTRMNNIISVDHTPICLPLMKNLANIESNSVSPVRRKADFEEFDPKFYPGVNNKNACTTASNNTLKRQMSINTPSSKEVCFHLKDYPNISLNSRILNPLAVTLNEGDEMHFLPIE